MFVNFVNTDRWGLYPTTLAEPAALLVIPHVFLLLLHHHPLFGKKNMRAVSLSLSFYCTVPTVRSTYVPILTPGGGLQCVDNRIYNRRSGTIKQSPYAQCPRVRIVDMETIMCFSMATSDIFLRVPTTLCPYLKCQ